MSMIRYFLFTACALAFAGCGPETAKQTSWMLGTFSNRTVGEKNVSAVTYYEFLEDGSLVVSGTTNKGETTGPRTYTWEQDGEDAVVVTLPEANPLTGDNWRFSPGADCNQIGMQGFKGDSLQASGNLHRGKVCIHRYEDMCPIGNQCDSSETRWCDEPPTSCPGTEDVR